MRRLRARGGGVLAAALVLSVAVTAGLAWHAHRDDMQVLAGQQRTIDRMEAKIDLLDARAGGQPDWAELAAQVEPSVFTIATDRDLGSGWVVRSDAAGSDLLTNFHVVADALASGTHAVQVQRTDQSMDGEVVRVDETDDLAVVHVRTRLAPLPGAGARPVLGQSVMVVGSPAGLGGTISIGVVSGFRSIGGSDWVQFSAPISPGNSGGPVVDTSGRVLGIASGKYEGDGVEALGFAIPVSVACASLRVCEDT